MSLVGEISGMNNICLNTFKQIVLKLQISDPRRRKIFVYTLSDGVCKMHRHTLTRDCFNSVQTLSVTPYYTNPTLIFIYNLNFKYRKRHLNIETDHRRPRRILKVNVSNSSEFIFNEKLRAHEVGVRNPDTN